MKFAAAQWSIAYCASAAYSAGLRLTTHFYPRAVFIATLMPKQLAPLVSSAEGIAQLLMNMCAPRMPASPLPVTKPHQPAVNNSAQQSSGLNNLAKSGSIVACPFQRSQSEISHTLENHKVRKRKGD